MKRDVLSFCFPQFLNDLFISQLIRIDKGLVFYRLLAEVSHHHHRVAPYLDEKEEDKIVFSLLFFFFVLCFFRPVPSHPSMALKGILFLSIFFFILSRAPLLGSNRCVAFSLLEDFPYRFVYRYSSGANIFFFFFKEGKIHIQKDQREGPERRVSLERAV